MASAVNILLIIGMIVGFFKAKLSIIVSILCFIISIFCFYLSFIELGNSNSPSTRQKAVNHVIINGFCIIITYIIILLNLVTYNLKLFIVFFILSIVFNFIVKPTKFIKKNNK